MSIIPYFVTTRFCLHNFLKNSEAINSQLSETVIMYLYINSVKSSPKSQNAFLLIDEIKFSYKKIILRKKNKLSLPFKNSCSESECMPLFTIEIIKE